VSTDERLFYWLILLAGGVIGFVIVVGGIVCLIEEGYTFEMYLTDLTNVWPYLIGAIGAVLLRSAIIGRRNGNGKRPSRYPAEDETLHK
jgi:hypothetical protein